MVVVDMDDPHGMASTACILTNAECASRLVLPGVSQSRSRVGLRAVGGLRSIVPFDYQPGPHGARWRLRAGVLQKERGLWMSQIFSPTSDAEVTRAILDAYARELDEQIVCDTIVVGGGPSGVVCARELSRKGQKVLLIEKNNYLGGGFWLGGFLMSKLTVRAPADKEMAKIGVRMSEYSPGLFVADAPEACVKLIASACDAGVKILNAACVDDLIIKGGRVRGVVVNWSAIQSLPRQVACVDPVSFEAKAVVDATGHDASVCQRAADRGLIEILGMGAMDADSSEDAVVNSTCQVYPGLFACGMSISTVAGLPRMGPTFGGMLLSGLKVADLIMEAAVAE